MAFERSKHFFNDTIWSTNIEVQPFHLRVSYRLARIAYIVVRGFTDERLNQQAAALTYVSFLSIVPLIAVLFSLAKGFGFEERMEPWIREVLNPLIDPDIVNQIITYVKTTSVTALGAMGGLVLIWAVMKTLLTLEKSFNQIWSVNNNRPLYRALAYYLSVSIIVPMLVAASATLMAMLQTEDPENKALQWFRSLPGTGALLDMLEKLLPFGITWVAFSLVFAFMVNTNVRLKAALSGAFVSALLWNLLQWIYIETQIGLSKNAIYGTFAFLPILMVYLYLCWLILLFGCRIAFALQNEGAFRRERMTRAAGLRFRAAAGLLILGEVARGFREGRKMERPNRMADRLDLPLQLVIEVLGLLKEAGILCGVKVEDRDNGANAAPPLPARALDKISLLECVEALESGDGIVAMPKGAMTEPLRSVLNNMDKARENALEGMTVQDLLEKTKN